MGRISRILEVFWLLLGIITLIGVVFLVATNGIREFKLWFLFPVVAFSMYFFRRFMSRKLARMEQNSEDQ
jgi:membrane protein implicated in regulation of membrane protease activity